MLREVGAQDHLDSCACSIPSAPTLDPWGREVTQGVWGWESSTALWVGFRPLEVEHSHTMGLDQLTQKHFNGQIYKFPKYISVRKMAIIKSSLQISFSVNSSVLQTPVH